MDDTTIINTTMTNVPITDKEFKVKHKVIRESNHGSKGRQSKSDHNPTVRAPTLNGVDSNITTIATTKGNEIISFPFVNNHCPDNYDSQKIGNVIYVLMRQV